MYARGRGTVGTVSKLLHCPINEALGTVLTAPGGLHAFSNTSDEHTEATSLLTGEPQVALEPTSLFILDNLRLLRTVVANHCMLSVSQSTIDANKRTEGVMQISLEGSTIVKHSSSAEQVQAAADHFEELIGWLRANCMVSGVSPEVAEQCRIEPDPREVVGDAAWDTALLAKETSLLLSDDLRFRWLARASLGVKSVCTVTLLGALLRWGKLQQGSHDEAIARLQSMGYQALPISAGTLLAAARLAQWKAGKHFLSLMRALDGPLPELQSVLRVTVQFVKGLWLLPTFEQARLALLFPLLDAIIVRRSAQVVLLRLQRAVKNEFRLLPLHMQEIRELIARWMEQRAPRL